MARRHALLLLAFALLAAGTQAPAQQVAALLISDVHFDPYADPALVPQLDAAPAARWPAILATPPSATQQQDDEAVRKACPVRAFDTREPLWQSTLAAVRAQAGPGSPAPARFIVYSGDLLAHEMDCKYRYLFPTHTHADFLVFADKTIRYMIASLRASVPGSPMYIAYGNNDTACGGNKLDPDNDFLAATAKIIAGALPRGDRRRVVRGLAEGGFYSVKMAAPMRHTRLIAIDNMFFLTELKDCAGNVPPPRAEEAKQLDWLETQLAAARRHRERVWVLGHVPPGVTLYTTYAKRAGKNICAGDPPAMSTDSERFQRILSEYTDITHLAIFAHTHDDELALIRPGLEPRSPDLTPNMGLPSIPVKIVPSVSPVNGNPPSFLVATVDPVHATLLDYTMFEASNSTGIGTLWPKKYTFTSTYNEPDFSGTSVTHLIDRFRADPDAATPSSQAYLADDLTGYDKHAYPMPFWPVLVCAMDHLTGKGFAACACSTAVPATK